MGNFVKHVVCDLRLQVSRNISCESQISETLVDSDRVKGSNSLTGHDPLTGNISKQVPELSLCTSFAQMVREPTQWVDCDSSVLKSPTTRGSHFQKSVHVEPRFYRARIKGGKKIESTEKMSKMTDTGQRFQVESVPNHFSSHEATMVRFERDDLFLKNVIGVSHFSFGVYVEEKQFIVSPMADSVFMKGRVSDFSFDNQVWEPGGIVAEPDQWDWLVEFYKCDRLDDVLRVLVCLGVQNRRLKTYYNFRELSHYGGKKREIEKILQGITSPNMRKKLVSLLINSSCHGGTVIELKGMSKFKDCDELYYVLQSSQQGQMHKGNKRLLLQEGKNVFHRELLVLNQKWQTIRFLFPDWWYGESHNLVSKHENESHEQVEIELVMQSKYTISELKLALYYKWKLELLIHLEDKVSIAGASKGRDKGLVYDKGKMKLRDDDEIYTNGKTDRLQDVREEMRFCGKRKLCECRLQLEQRLLYNNGLLVLPLRPSFSPKVMDQFQTLLLEFLTFEMFHLLRPPEVPSYKEASWLWSSIKWLMLNGSSEKEKRKKVMESLIGAKEDYNSRDKTLRCGLCKVARSFQLEDKLVFREGSIDRLHIHLAFLKNQLKSG